MTEDIKEEIKTGKITIVLDFEYVEDDWASWDTDIKMEGDLTPGFLMSHLESDYKDTFGVQEQLSGVINNIWEER